MRKVFIFLQSLAILCLAIIRYIPSPDDHESLLVKDLLSFISQYTFWIVFLLAFYIFCYSLWPKCLAPRRKKKKFIQKLLSRINEEIFDKDLENHRITLFKEISWVYAIIRNYYYLFYHLILFGSKWKIYLRWPKRGRYIKVYLRCGINFHKSSTMFRVEENEKSNCTGVAGYIRYKHMAAQVEELPDITDVDVIKFRQIESIVDEDIRNRVKEYMRKGFIRNFDDLKKIHRRARHFYGTIIERKGRPWGVLLVDSTSERSPFTPAAKKRVDSFALTIGDVIDLEV